MCDVIRKIKNIGNTKVKYSVSSVYSSCTEMKSDCRIHILFSEYTSTVTAPSSTLLLFDLIFSLAGYKTYYSVKMNKNLEYKPNYSLEYKSLDSNAKAA